MAGNGQLDMCSVILVGVDEFFGQSEELSTGLFGGIWTVIGWIVALLLLKNDCLSGTGFRKREQNWGRNFFCWLFWGAKGGLSRMEALHT